VIPPGKPTIVVQRRFDAPRHLVFAAMTKPEYLAQWWGFRASSLVECRIDLRRGGAWRFVLRMPDGSQHGFGGVYREVAPPERIVQTFRYDGIDAEAVETAVLEEQDGGTLLTVTVLHSSVENRDGHVASGMEAGATESHDRLAELLATMVQAARSASKGETR
jgi:uncharacterized protein YndB with AHSA1/START domain